MKKKTALLVDDEEIVRSGLAQKIPWQTAGLQLVGTAENGKVALEMLRTRAVDVVITDVVMPEVDGLKLVERAEKMPVPPKFVILSGYNEFQFAQKAMQLGVRHYVLKPTDPSELLRVLVEVSAEIDRERRGRSQASAAEQTLEEARPLLKSSAIRQLLSGLPAAARARSLVGRSLGIRLNRDLLAVLLVDWGEATPRRLQEGQLILERTVGAETLLGGLESDGYACHLLRNPEPAGMPGRLQEFCSRAERLARGPVRAVFSAPAPACDLPRLYAAALSCLRHAFYCGEKRILRCPDAPQGFSKTAPPELRQALQRMPAAVRTAEAPQIRQIIRAAVLAAAQASLEPAILKSRCMEMLLQLNNEMGKETGETIRIALAELSASQNAGDLERALDACLTGISACIRTLTRGPQGRMVEQLKHVIHERFAERGLSLKRLSTTVVFANEDYLGRLFHKATGRRFSDYLAATRIEEAKRLLSVFPHMSVAEVARRVGYGDNPQYFSVVFRKAAGMTASDFRKKSG